MKKLRFSPRFTPQILWILAPLVLSGIVLTWRLGTSPAGISATELDQCSGAMPAVYAPYYWLMHLLPVDCGVNHTFWLRLPSVLFAMLAGTLFVTAVKNWFGHRTAIYAAALFLLASWFLHAGRLAAPEVMLLAIVPAWLALFQRARFNPDSRLTGLYAVLTISLTLFVPGGIWFVLLAAIWKGNEAISFLRRIPVKLTIPMVAIPLAASIYLIIGLSQHQAQLWTWMGWPGEQPWLTILRHIAAVPFHLFARGPEAPMLWLAHRPILDVFTTAMVIIGSIRIIRHASHPKLIVIIALSIVCVILTGLRASGIATLNLIVPLMYFLAAGGIHAMLRRWFQIFPRNPFAKWLAYSLMAIVVTGAVILNLRDYFVAWPNSTATRQVFSIKP